MQEKWVDSSREATHITCIDVVYYCNMRGAYLILCIQAIMITSAHLLGMETNYVWCITCVLCVKANVMFSVHLLGMETNKICGVDLHHYIYKLCVYTCLLSAICSFTWLIYNFFICLSPLIYDSSWRYSILLVCLHRCS